jgi:hypothetical protein
VGVAARCSASDSCGHLWSYERQACARRFVDNWKAALKWQRLKPYERFAQMIERHWDDIAAYGKPEHKASLRFVEGSAQSSPTVLGTHPSLNNIDGMLSRLTQPVARSLWWPIVAKVDAITLVVRIYTNCSAGKS